MAHLHHTPTRPRRSASAAAIDANANARLMAMLTPVRGRGRLSTAALTSPPATANFRRDEDGVSSFEESSSDLEENECCTCLEQLTADDIASISDCEHTFCAECIIRWADTRNACPLCRTRFTSIESADGALQQVSGRRSAAAAADLDIILARLLGREEVGTLSEVFWGSVNEHEAYWSVIAASITITLNEINERGNQLMRRGREVLERNREVRVISDQLKQMHYELNDRADDLARLSSLSVLELNEVHRDDTWILEEKQEIINEGQQQCRILSDWIVNEHYQILDELDQIDNEKQNYDETYRIIDEIRQIIRDAVEQFDSASPLPTVTNLPTLRRAVQIVINSEHMFELTDEMLANLQA